MKKNSFLLVLLLVSNVLFAQKNLVQVKFGEMIFQCLKEKKYEKLFDSFIDSTNLDFFCKKYNKDYFEKKEWEIKSNSRMHKTRNDLEKIFVEDLKNDFEAMTTFMGVNFKNAILKNVSINLLEEYLIKIFIEIKIKNKEYILFNENIFYNQESKKLYLTSNDFFIIDGDVFEKQGGLKGDFNEIKREIKKSYTALYQPIYKIDEIVFGKIFNYKSKDAEFPGGENLMIDFITKNIQYPKSANLKNIQGEVLVSFIVNEDGTISNEKVLKDIGEGCGEEAIRLIKLMPKWTPGSINGKPIKTLLRIPITFSLY